MGRLRFPGGRRSVTEFAIHEIQNLEKNQAHKVDANFKNIYRALRELDAGRGPDAYVADEIVAFDETGTFKAKKNGGHSKTIQEAIDKSKTGLTFLKSGEYNIDTPLVLPPNSGLWGAGASTVLNVSCDTGITNKSVNGGTHGLEVRDMALRGGGSGKGIDFKDAVEEGEVDLLQEAWTRPDGQSSGRFSYAKCKDGRVIAVYGSGSHLTQAYTGNLQSFLAGDNTLSDHQMIFAGSIEIRGTVFNVKGELYLVIARLNNDEGTDEGRYNVQIYKSPLGDGTDWTLYSVVRETDGPYASRTFWGTVPISAPLVLDNGRWVIAYPYFSYFTSDVASARYGIATSDNNGQYWTHRYDWGAYMVGGIYTDWVSRSLAFYDGRVWCACASHVATGRATIKVSDNNGTDWYHLYNIRGSNPYWNDMLDAINYFSFFAWDGYLWMIGPNYAGGSNIYRTKTPENGASWERVWSGGFGGPRDSFTNYFEDENRWVLSTRHRVNGHLFDEEPGEEKPVIEGVRVSGFNKGISLDVLGGHIISRSHIEENDTGIFLGKVTQGNVSINIITKNKIGVHASTDSYHNLIVGNNILANDENIKNEGTLNEITANK